MTQLTAGIRLRELHVGAYNPRGTMLADEAWMEFKESIRQNGVLQSILIRPVEGKKTAYEVVAGQRRFCAALEVYGPDFEIPHLLKEMTDAEAEVAAAAENIDRAPMSPAEEAEAAARVLARVGGDRIEAAKRLGWSKATLDNRLKLMACSVDVRKALSEKVISLGLAELMSGMTHAKQSELLKEFIARGVPTLDDAKQQILSLTKTLTAAIFDKTECGACPHNSARQQAMFGNIGEGHCLNAPCFDAKTETQLKTVSDALQEDYQRISIVRPGETYTIAKLLEASVGSVQASACRQCKDFGAVVSGMPNSLGKVSRDICFDTECNGKKVQTHKEATELAAAQALAEQQAASVQASDSEKAGPPEADGQGETTVSPVSKAEKTVKEAESVEPVALTNGVYEFRDKLYRAVIHKEYASNPEFNAHLVLALLLSRKGSYFDADALRKALVKGNMLQSVDMKHDLAKTMKEMVSAPIDRARGCLTNLGATAITGMTRDELTSLTVLSKADLANYFSLNSEAGKEFLNALTKSQISAVCSELGITEKMGDSFKAISNGKKADFIDKVVSVEGFDYKGKVPKVLGPKFAK